MIGHQVALIRREIWEHRSLYVTPIAIASIVTLGTLAALLFASGFASELHAAIFGAQNLAGDGERRLALTIFFIGTSWLFLIALAVLCVFYSLDALYSERKDKSILFWRSLPVTDTETVLSKLLMSVLIIPTVFVLAIMATHLINLIITSLWVSSKGGDAGMLIWASVPIVDNWLATFIIVIASSIWMSPFVGWFLFVSAYAKRSPFLWAFLPLVLLPLVEFIVFRSRVFAAAVLDRGDGLPLFRSIDLDSFFDEDHWRLAQESASMLSLIDIGKFLSSPSMWAGVLVCGLLTTAAIYVRRYRDDS